MRRRAQSGAVGAIVLAFFALVLTGLVASYVLSRFTTRTGEREQTVARLALAQEALERFAATTQRLPCPADPAADTGLEAQASPTTCSFSGGTVPWRTLGMKREEAYDAWGRKVSYRVYTGVVGSGSLTQPSGASMVACDTAEPVPLLGAGALCNTGTGGTNIYERNTTPAQFLAGKGFALTDMGTARADVAYVLVSHGATGLGAYTASGTRRELPNAGGDERSNTTATGPFVIKAFSPVDTAATSNVHFDDFVAYRRIDDLISRAGLAARDWPEGAIFDGPTMMAAVGNTNLNTGRSSFSYMGNTFSATGGNVSYMTSGTAPGIGVIGADGQAALTRTEIIRMDLGQAARRFALTMANFTHFTFMQKHREQVILRFYDGGSLVGTVRRFACSPTSGLASLVASPPGLGQMFSAVEIEPDFYSPDLFSFSSSFVISEVAACGTSTICGTTLSTTANACVRPSLTAAFNLAEADVGQVVRLKFTLGNGTDRPRHDGLAFEAALPAALDVANPSNFTQTCSGGSGTAARRSTGTISAVDTATETLTTSANHNGALNATVTFSANPPAPLVVNTPYYIVAIPASNRLRLSATRGGLPVDITGATTGGAYTIHAMITISGVTLDEGAVDCEVGVDVSGTSAGVYSLGPAQATEVSNLINAVGGAGTISAVNAATDTLTTSENHAGVVGGSLVFSSAPPAPLETGIIYYIAAIPGSSQLRLSATPGGAVIDITGSTTGGEFVISRSLTVRNP